MRTIVSGFVFAVLRRFIRRNEGEAGVEMGLIALPFFSLLFAIADAGLYVLGSQTLEVAVADNARLIMTGQAQMQSPPLSAATFKSGVCDSVNQIAPLIDCSGGVQIDVRTVASFAGANPGAPPRNADGTYNYNGFGYNPGVACDIVVVRAVYEWRPFGPISSASSAYGSWFGASFVDPVLGKRLLMATAAFRNEPYNTQTGCP